MPSRTKRDGNGQQRQRQRRQTQQNGPGPEPPGVSLKKLNKPQVVAMEDTEQLLTVNDALTSAECTEWITFAEALGMASTRPPGGKPRRGEAYRDNFRTQITSRQIADSLWNAGLGHILVDALPPLRDGRRPVAFNDNIRLYRYSKGQKFGKHFDETASDSMGRNTVYTTLVYLSAVRGGETVFYPQKNEEIIVAPRAGMALFHRHGIDCWLHEALPVASGEKYVLRTDVVFG